MATILLSSSGDHSQYKRLTVYILCLVYLQCLYGMSAIASHLNGLIPLYLNVLNI